MIRHKRCRPPFLQLQVSTACRTGLQHARGDCSVILHGSAQQLQDVTAWASQHAGLMSHMQVNSTACDTIPHNQPSPLDGQMASALAALRSLQSLDLDAISEHDRSLAYDRSISKGLPAKLWEIYKYRLASQRAQHVQLERPLTSTVAALTALTSLTRLVGVELGPTAIAGLPHSLAELDVIVNASAELRAMFRSHSQDGLVLDFGYMGQLRHLVLKVRSNGTIPSLTTVAAVPVVVNDIWLCLPNGLTELRVLGRIHDLCGHQQTLSSMRRLTAVKGGLEGMISAPCLAKLITHMPALTFLHVSGSLCVSRRDLLHDPDTMFVLDGPCQLWPAQAQQLSAAVGSATALTSLSFMGFKVQDDPDFVWFGRFQQLQQLQSLRFGYVPVSATDVLALSSLKRFTSLQLGCGQGLQLSDETFVGLCAGLTGLKELIVNESELVLCAEVFAAAAKLTALTVLDLGENHCMEGIGEDLQLLQGLKSLTDLTLPPCAEDWPTECFDVFLQGMLLLSCFKVRRPTVSVSVVYSNWLCAGS